jgi:hypothetical protein
MIRLQQLAPEVRVRPGVMQYPFFARRGLVRAELVKVRIELVAITGLGIPASDHRFWQAQCLLDSQCVQTWGFPA